MRIPFFFLFHFFCSVFLLIFLLCFKYSLSCHYCSAGSCCANWHCKWSTSCKRLIATPGEILKETIALNCTSCFEEKIEEKELQLTGDYNSSFIESTELCKAFKTCKTARGFSQLKEKIKSLLGNEQGSKSVKLHSIIKILQLVRDLSCQDTQVFCAHWIITIFSFTWNSP